MPRNGTVNVREFGPEKAVMDFTSTAYKILSPNTVYGRAFREISSRLLQHEEIKSSDHAEKKGSLIVDCSIDEVRGRLWFLTDQQGVIISAAANIAEQEARRATEVKTRNVDTRRIIIARRLAEATVMNGIIEIEDAVNTMKNAEPIGRLCVAALRPFADAVSTHDETVGINYYPTPAQSSDPL